MIEYSRVLYYYTGQHYFRRVYDYVYINWNINAHEKAYTIFLKII